MSDAGSNTRCACQGWPAERTFRLSGAGPRLGPGPAGNRTGLPGTVRATEGTASPFQSRRPGTLSATPGPQRERRGARVNLRNRGRGGQGQARGHAPGFPESPARGPGPQGAAAHSGTSPRPRAAAPGFPWEGGGGPGGQGGGRPGWTPCWRQVRPGYPGRKRGRGGRLALLRGWGTQGGRPPPREPGSLAPRGPRSGPPGPARRPLLGSRWPPVGRAPAPRSQALKSRAPRPRLHPRLTSGSRRPLLRGGGHFGPSRGHSALGTGGRGARPRDPARDELGSAEVPAPAAGRGAGRACGGSARGRDQLSRSLRRGGPGPAPAAAHPARKSPG